MTRMKDSGIEWIGEVPEEWGIKKLSQSFSEHKLKNLGNIEQNLLSLSYGKIVRKSIKSSVGLLPESFETYNIIDSNDIVLRLTDLQNDKRSLRTGLANERGIITSAYLTIRLIDGNDSAKYYHYLLHSYDKCKVFYNFGGGVRQGGTWDDLSVLKMIVPPKDEQTKIADFLDKKVAQLDKVKSLLEEQIKTLEDYRQSLIYETVTKGLDKTVALKDSGVDWIGQIPEGWGVKKHKYIMSKTKTLCSHYSGQKILSLTRQGVISRDIESGKGKMPASFDGYQFLTRGDLLLCLFDIDVTPRCVGVVESDGLTSPAYSRFKVSEDSSVYYYYYLFLSMDDDKVLLHLAKNLRNSLTEDDFGDIETIVPSYKEQVIIANYLNKKTLLIDKLIKLKKEQIENINKQRQTLIYDYVTGKRRV